MSRRVYGLTSRSVYRFLTGLAGLIVRVFARWDVVGVDRIPRDGPLVVVANHLHLLDPPLVAASMPRRVHPMAKRELFDTPLVGWVLWPYGAFPVRRFSADMGALRAARNLLRQGGAVLMFPEGTRSKDVRLHPALPGAAMVALLAKAPVLPVAITGTEQVRIPGSLLGCLVGRRVRLRVEFGEPIYLDGASADGQAAERATDQIMRVIASMLPEPYRGAYGPGSEETVVFARQERERDG